MLKRKNNKAFTLIELLVVISIIGLLSTIAMGSFNKARKKAREAKMMYDLKIVADTVVRYNIDNMVYPNHSGVCGNSGVIASSTKICSGHSLKMESNTYIDRIPTHPVNGEYYFYQPYGSSPPCLYVILKIDQGITYYFVCQGGKCFNTDSTSLSLWCSYSP
jgi:type II secretion system protein G